MSPQITAHSRRSGNVIPLCLGTALRPIFDCSAYCPAHRHPQGSGPVLISGLGQSSPRSISHMSSSHAHQPAHSASLCRLFFKAAAWLLFLHGVTSLFRFPNFRQTGIRPPQGSGPAASFRLAGFVLSACPAEHHGFSPLIQLVAIEISASLRALLRRRLVITSRATRLPPSPGGRSAIRGHSSS